MKRAAATYPRAKDHMADFLAMTFAKGAPYYVFTSSAAAIYA
jgi:hypothetical protein